MNFFGCMMKLKFLGIGCFLRFLLCGRYIRWNGFNVLENGGCFYKYSVLECMVVLIIGSFVGYWSYKVVGNWRYLNIC